MSTIIGTTLNADTIRKTGGSLGTDIRVKNTSVYESDGGTSVTQNLVQGLAKVWVNMNKDSTIQDSLNVATLTDHSTGNYSANFTNAMGNASYSYTATASNWETGNNGDSFMGVSGYHGGQATTSQRVFTYRERYDVGATPAAKDSLTTNITVNGDLA